MKDGFECKSGNVKSCLAKLRTSTKFGQLGHRLALHGPAIVLDLPSSLEYYWHDSKGEAHDWRHPFTLSLPVGVFKESNECGGPLEPAIITTKTQKFRLDAQGYRIPLVFETTLKPGQTVPLRLPVEAEKSSLHHFTVVLQLSDGREIRSQPIELNYYRPRWFNEDLMPVEIAADPEVEDESAYVSLENTAFEGEDLRRIGDTNRPACSDACTVDRRCQGYTYDSWRRVCTLKGALRSMRLEPGAESGLRKGVSEPPKSEGAIFIERLADKTFDWRGDEIFMGANLQECEQHCLNEKACVAFTLFKRSAGDCYLLNGAEPGDPPLAPPQHGAADSGIKRQKAEK